MEQGQLLFSLVGHEGWVYTGEFSPNSKQIVTSSGDGTFKVWSAENGERLFDLAGHFPQMEHSLRLARFSPNSETIVTAVAGNTAKVWHAADGTWLFESCPKDRYYR